MKCQPLSVPPWLKFLSHDNWQLHSDNSDDPTFTKAVSRLFFSIAISKQLYAAPYLGGVHSISLGHYYRKIPCQHVCTSLSPRPMTVVFGLGTRLCVGMRTTLENGVLHNGQQPDSAVNIFINQCEFVGMKMLSCYIAPCCDKHPFCDKMTVSTWSIFEMSLFDEMVSTKKGEKWHFC